MIPYDSYYRRLQDEWLAGRADKVIPMAEAGLDLYPTQHIELNFELCQALIQTGSTTEAVKLLEVGQIAAQVRTGTGFIVQRRHS